MSEPGGAGLSRWKLARGWLGGAGVCVGAMLLVFLVPLTVPVYSQQTISISSLAGYNNGAAVLLTAGISGLVFLISVWQGWGRKRAGFGPRL